MFRTRGGASGGSELTPLLSEAASHRSEPTLDESFFRSINRLALKLNPLYITDVRNIDQLKELFLWSCRYNYVELLNFIYKEKALESAKTILDKEGHNGLHIAAMNNSAEACLFLIERFDFNINKKSRAGISPLYYAIKSFNNCATGPGARDIMQKKFDTFEILLEKKARTSQYSDLRSSAIAEIMAIEWHGNERFLEDINRDAVIPLTKSAIVSGARIYSFLPGIIRKGPSDSAGENARLSICEMAESFQFGVIFKTKKIRREVEEIKNNKLTTIARVRESMTKSCAISPPEAASYHSAEALYTMSHSSQHK